MPCYTPAGKRASPFVMSSSFIFFVSSIMPNFAVRPNAISFCLFACLAITAGGTSIVVQSADLTQSAERARLADLAQLAQLAEPPPLPGAERARAPAAEESKSANAVPACTTCGKVMSVKPIPDTEAPTPLGSKAIAGESGAQTTMRLSRDPANKGLVTMESGGGGQRAKRAPNKKRGRYEITVLLDDGTNKIVSFAYEPFVHEGDRVRVTGNTLELVQ